jgi:rhamnose utilization protein RhaD (predicted bifunctional aldolase and dehydrogenase)/NAD(P)-dependent dehydrogenase (short-subunit alcohol dehydrogenase family)
MKSTWTDKEAAETVARYTHEGVNEDLALRVYTTRLLGRNPLLVLHGGGNTSVKTTVTDLLGEDVQVLCVKGSGWDMADIEPPGLPAVRMELLLKLRSLKMLSDEDMVRFQRGALLDPSSPNPSVETLLHSFLPHKFVDHTHSAAVLALTDQCSDEPLLGEVYGDRVALVDYVKPGFDLAQTAAQVYEAHPEVEGLILRKHGIFSFGATAREAYERMVNLVTLAENYITAMGGGVFPSVELPTELSPVSEVAPIVRGLLAVRGDESMVDPVRVVLDFRASEAVLNYVTGMEVGRYAQIGVVTPDHVIRTKKNPLIVPTPEAGQGKAFREEVREMVERYVADYRAYFARHDGVRERPKKALDPMPRVVLVPGLGLFGVGSSAAAARIAADLAENTVRVITDAEAIGAYQPVDEAATFDIEYWSLEQAKLSKDAEKPLARQVVMITGGAGGIGGATARAFATHGAEVAVLDLDGGKAEEVAVGINGLGMRCDVTDGDDVRAAFDGVCEEYGGVDIVISNAGAAWQGKIGEVDDRTLRESFELNFFGHQTVAQNAVRVMLAQGTGGALLFNASKQAVNPGSSFGPYGLPKAATLFLAKQYALEYGHAGIRSNSINADRVNTGMFTDGFLEERAGARGLSPEEYLRTGNLLGREVLAEDVAQAFVVLALARKTTAATLTVDGGNIEASLR